MHLLLLRQINLIFLLLRGWGSLSYTIWYHTGQFPIWVYLDYFTDAKAAEEAIQRGFPLERGKEEEANKVPGAIDYSLSLWSESGWCSSHYESERTRKTITNLFSYREHKESKDAFEARYEPILSLSACTASSSAGREFETPASPDRLWSLIGGFSLRFISLWTQKCDGFPKRNSINEWSAMPFVLSASRRRGEDFQSDTNCLDAFESLEMTSQNKFFDGKVCLVSG